MTLNDLERCNILILRFLRNLIALLAKYVPSACYVMTVSARCRFSCSHLSVEWGLVCM